MTDKMRFFFSRKSQIKETPEQMRDKKYIESRCFHTGMDPELIKQLTSHHALGHV
jgi:hypothetical protein